MSIAQIYSIIALLVAFNVPQATVTQVQGILEQSHTPSQISTPLPQVSAPDAGATGGSVSNTPEALVPTSIIFVHFSYESDANTPLVAYGGNCSQVVMSMKVLDQNGNEIVGAPIRTGNTKVYNPYGYMSPNFNTVDTLTFNSNGFATTTINVNVGGAMADNNDPGIFFKDSPTVWRVKQSGANYNPITNTCQ